MTKSQLKKYNQVLESKLKELTQMVANDRDEIVIDKYPDQLDEVQGASDRLLKVTNLDRNSQNLRSVQAALQRIVAGEFGLCQGCEKDISLVRLNAVPWATFCIPCQEKAERARSGNHALLPEIAAYSS